MKRILSLLLIMLCSAVVSPAQQTIASSAKVSASTLQYLHDAGKQLNASTRLPGYVYKRINNKTYISAFIKVNSSIDLSSLDAIGVYIGTKAGNVWTAQIPVEKISALISTAGIDYIALDEPIIRNLDQARKQTKADSAQNGIGLAQRMTGKNVVLGVIDAGFDFTHPTLFDTSYAAYRVKRVWRQKRDGIPPTGFAYGTEITDSAAILSMGSDTTILSHGTHVAGIAGGSGYGSHTNNLYRGMAYESEMAMVCIMPAPGEWAVAGESDIVDGVNYIFNYAASVGKPAVVNLSWGSTIGPHDGSSLFSQAIDGLTGPGKIFVCAAGNNGEDTVHLKKMFTTTDSIVNTFVTFSPYLDSANQRTWVDIWGDTGKSYCINLKLYNADTVLDSTGYICLDGTTHDTYLIGSNGDTCFINVTTIASEYNDKPHMLLYAYSRVHDNLCLSAKATDGTVNMWEGYVLPPEGYYGYLKSLNYPWAVDGDVNMTVSDIGCTRSAITVGAYTSKTGFTNISGEALGYPGALAKHIAPFSSLGPTCDGRIKPDITAPGFALASSINSFDTTYLSGGTNYIGIVAQYISAVTGRTYSYAMLAGTSMASPCASGIIAMLLQLNATLTPDSVKAILDSTAIKDIYTGTISAAGSNVWGHGKINAYGGVKHIVAESVESINIDPLDCILYPNPNKGMFTIDYKSSIAEQLKIELFNNSGQVITTQYWNVIAGNNSKQYNLSSFAKGVYFTKVSAHKGYNVIKTVIE